MSKSAKFSRAANSNEEGGSKDNVMLSGESGASDHHKESHAQNEVMLSKSTNLLTGAKSNKEGATKDNVTLSAKSDKQKKLCR